MSTAVGLPAARKGTYAFLSHARSVGHVYLATDVDASALVAARAASPVPLSYTSFVLAAAGRVIKRHPDAQLMLTGRFRPRLHSTGDIHAKVLFDKTVDGQRCVLSGTVRDVDVGTLGEIQASIDTFKNGQVGPDGPFAAAGKLGKLPLPLIHLLYRVGLRKPALRSSLQGTFSVTSVGQVPVRTILPMISGTVGFGLGRISDEPVVRDGELAVARILPLSMSFDHRVIDGALAADILAELKSTLESWELS